VSGLRRVPLPGSMMPSARPLGCNPSARQRPTASRPGPPILRVIEVAGFVKAFVKVIHTILKHKKFAECTEDFQWIHLDEEKAAKGPFGTTIAHGFLTLSLLPKLGSSVRLPALEGLNRVMGVNYGLNKVRFINPVPVGSRVRARVTLKDAVAKSPERILFTYTYVFEIEGKEKPACIAESLGMTVIRPD